jgi:hypothetical protein
MNQNNLEDCYLYLTTKYVVDAELPAGGRLLVVREFVGKTPQSLRQGCRARGYPGRQHPTASTAGVELEEAQASAGRLGQHKVGGPRQERRPTRARMSKPWHRQWLPPAAVEPTNSRSMTAAEDSVESRSAPPPPVGNKAGAKRASQQRWGMSS